jgi:hypothetical protein
MPYPYDPGATARGTSLDIERRKNKPGMSAQCWRAKVMGAVQ